MINVNMMSGNFAHAHCSTWWKHSKNIKYEYGTKNNTISIYIDGGMYSGFNDGNDGKLKFLWILESRQYDGDATENAKRELQRIKEVFTEVWTHNDELINLDPIFKWSPAYGTYVEDYGIHKKTKKISMITSNKQSTPQHQFRYKFANDNREKFDLYGRGFQEIQNKETGLNDYMFSVAIENDTYDTYFTEKILDCFATGTIPIYKGTRKVINHFNENGILFLDDINLEDLNEDLYLSKMDAIKDNFERVQKLDTLDDWIFENYLIKYV
jgi:hypothetical protein